FKAAFLPGFMLAGLYIIYILVRTRLNPELAPLPEPSPDAMTVKDKLIYGPTIVTMLVGTGAAIVGLRWIYIHVGSRFNPKMLDDTTALIGNSVLWVCLAIVALAAVFIFFLVGVATTKEAWAKSKGMVAPLLIVFVVLGSIYGGITGITEAAAMGSLAVLTLIWIRKEFSFTLLREASMRTFKSTGTIIWVTLGATALAGAYTIAGGPAYVANLIVGYELPTLGVLLVMMVIFLFLGAFMDWTGIVLLVMPVFLPIVLKLPMNELGLTGGLDSPSMVRVWFGILFCVNMQVSFLSPPFGPAAFYLKSVAPPHITLPDIFRGFLPFMCMQVVILALILLVPEITTVFL
ncbi:MAG: TRAP transporter large permease subunit, partial [Desulfofustis sp.]|nr:TRAP transporter large permease subunit [Desulfofustis sp.]